MFIKGGPEPLEKESHEFLGSKRDDRMRELSHVARGLTENAEAKQVRKTNRTDILYQIGKTVR